MTRRNKQTKDVQDVNAFMHEVEEAMHMEQLQTFWHTHKVTIIAVVVIAFGGFSGFKFYKNQQENSLVDASNAYYESTKSAQDSTTVLEELYEADAEGVALLARLAAAKDLANQGKVSDAMLSLDQIILNENLSLAYRHLAQIYKAEMALSSDVALAQGILEKMMADGSMYLPSAMELLGYTYEKQGNNDRARELYKQIVNMGPKAPSGVSVRAQQRLNALRTAS